MFLTSVQAVLLHWSSSQLPGHLAAALGSTAAVAAVAAVTLVGKSWLQEVPPTWYRMLLVTDKNKNQISHFKFLSRPSIVQTFESSVENVSNFSTALLFGAI